MLEYSAALSRVVEGLGTLNDRWCLLYDAARTRRAVRESDPPPSPLAEIFRRRDSKWSSALFFMKKGKH
ncbi:hypothetical protein DPMN_118590 [Dreissena polymorpha]|uniref:Uncharacterized protein n=1 Tax=Dreissena polymorpha TaxID=45954 RepID=A0A9D4GKD8_DREPO|nr:hypothetical protein DPMN_118590 [Dreissena polymorpha]